VNIEKILKEKDLKVTPQRKAILSALIQTDSLMTAQELFQEVIRLLPGTNFSTVYRNLDTMLSKGLLCRITSESGAVMCKGCGTSIPLDYCPMEKLKDHLSEHGFTPTEHRFEIYGYCRKCSRV
jgi:Fe2+ or Zn2+ uptake regulation protein